MAEPNTQRLQPGDWILSLNGTVVPFYPPEGTTAWFQNQLHQHSNHPITIKIRKPLAIGGGDTLERTYSVTSVRPPNLHVPNDGTRSRHPSFNRGIHNSGGSEIEESGEPRLLTANPDFVRNGTRIFHKSRASIQVKAVEKLGRYRIIFHDINHHLTPVSDKLQHEIFGEMFSNCSFYGNSVKEYHAHACLTEHGGKFLPTTHANCSLGGSYACSFEMHETVERIYEKAAVQCSTRDYLLGMPDHITSGPVSIGSLRRFSNMTDSEAIHHRIHLEILSLTGVRTPLLKTWCSPLIHCKHSINIVVVDAQAFFGDVDLELRLSKLLSEIQTYSRDFTTTGEEESSVDGRVLLVLTNAEHIVYRTLKEAIYQTLKPHLNRLVVVTDEQYPFVLYSQTALIRIKLLSELRTVTDSPLTTNHIASYPHIGVMLSQQFNKEGFQFIESDDLQERLRILTADTDIDQNTFETICSGTLHYLQNTGIAYVPEHAYSKSIGKGCANITHSLLIRPHRLAAPIESLSLGKYTHVEHALASETDLKRVLQCATSEKIIGILKDLHVILPSPNNHGNMKVLFPLISNRQVTELPLPHDKTPNLVMSYKGNECFLLIISFLNKLSLEARTCHVDYHITCGRFDLFNCDIVVARTAQTPWGRSKKCSMTITDQSWSFFIISSNSEKTSIRCFVRDLVKLVNDFHKDFKPIYKPIFGPPCPLSNACVDIEQPFHIINVLQQSPILSCSGINLENTETVTDYLWHGIYANTPGSRAKREQILNRPACNAPLKILEKFDKENALHRNWISLAKQHNYSQQDLDTLATQDSPTCCLLGEMSRNAYSLSQFIVNLNDMERMDIVHELTEWIDQEVTSGRS